MDSEEVDVEEEMERELQRISLSCLEQDEEVDEEPPAELEVFSDELPESILHCLHYVKNRAENSEKLILEDLEDLDTLISSRSEAVPSHASALLAELASEYNEDPEMLKTRILAEVEEQDSRDKQLSFSSVPNINNIPQDNDFVISAYPESSSLDRGDMSVTLDYIEVEKRCRKDLQLWEERHKQTEDENRLKLKLEKEMWEMKKHEQEERRRLWQADFETEKKKLEIIQKQQQAKLMEDEEKEKAAMAEESKRHEELINRLQQIMHEEKKIFEEQKEKERQIKQALQCKAATKIQARFRGFLVYRKFSPRIKTLTEENRKKKELQKKMDEERKALKAKIKRQLEEKKQKEEERKLKEEEESKLLQEIKKNECIKLEMRRQEYEKKKEAEKQRLEREKQLKLEEQKQIEERKQKEKTARNNLEGKKSKTQVNKSFSETDGGHELDKGPEVCREEPVIESELEKDHRKGKEEINEVISKRCDKKEQLSIVSESTEQQSKASQKNSAHQENSAEMKDRVTKLLRHTLKTQDRDVEIGPKIKGHVTKGSELAISYNTQTMETWHIQEAVDGQPINKALSKGQSFRQEEINCNDVAPLDNVSHGTEIPEIKENDYPRQHLLPDHIEEKRLEWMKNCIPWSRVLSENQRKKVMTKSRPRKSSAAHKLPPLSAEIILKTGPWHALKQVTTVTLEDLPGCSLSTLSECAKLQALTLRRCSLIGLEGLDGCKELKYIDVQENNIQVLNCEALENLCILLLSNNRLTSIHGLEGCVNLRNLELSFNKITRIGGLECLRSLQQLIIDHNQLISTKGLEATPTLMHLDCSFNHLTELEGIRNCGLMQILKLQGNNLSKPPALENQVLLRELYLDDNSVTELETMSSFWMPLLQILSLSQNSLTRLAPFSTFVSLEKLDISNNCLSDLQNVLAWIDGCENLRELSLNGNPLLQEAEWKLACSTLEFSLIQCRYFEDIINISNEHRYAHEYGDLNVNETSRPETKKNPLKERGADDFQHHTPFIGSGGDVMRTSQSCSTSRSEKSVLKKSTVRSQQRSEKKENTIGTASHKEMEHSSSCDEGFTSTEVVRKDVVEQKPVYAQRTREHSAATVIQSQWRGYAVRRHIRFYIALHEAAVVIQTAWRNFCIRRSTSGDWRKGNPERKHKAATRIQACWKGFYLRKKLSAALAAIAFDELDEDFEEVNLDDFTYDEAALEKEWLALDSSPFSSKTLLLSNQLYRPKNPILTPANMPPILPWHPHQAWQCDDVSQARPIVTHERKEFRSSSESTTLSGRPYSRPSDENMFKSGKEEIISEEWGFKDAATAQLMLRRAEKMKSKQSRTRKLLDPAVRLALFRSNENKHVLVKPPRKIQPARVEYFRGREEEFACSDKVPSEKIERSKELTYQWLHTQCGDHEATSSRIMKCNRFLPELDPEVLNGGRVQLVASLVSREAMDLELVSMTSGSDLTQNKEKAAQTHRHSAGSSSGDTLVTTKRDGGAVRKERISFRDNPVQLSGGWGGGKKRTKPFKITP
ncbi:leucine-rich repeat and IQ domain-containing protein 1 isoform X2 [Ambystoma mexicanum]|uniref:leucine-rich repeat and IQ domain-containing protein 1 isoform X2 n=1 Tax=Ambystoma mexicanum TaxID=8296 RepID=UPI0037E946B7